MCEILASADWRAHRKILKTLNGPCSESGLVPSATTSSVLRELPKETLEGLAKGESPEFLGVEKGSAIKRIGEVICETPEMRIRQQKLGSQKVRQQLHTAAILSHTAQAIALHIPRRGLLCAWMTFSTNTTRAPPGLVLGVKNERETRLRMAK